jgi:hypothetical protein
VLEFYAGQVSPRFRFAGDFAQGTAQITAQFPGTAPVELVTPISLLRPEAALAEAMFF